MTSRDDKDHLAALALLGLGPDASHQEILSAYRRLARSSHPDTAQGAAPSHDFARINAAYRFLTSGHRMAPAPTVEPSDNNWAASRASEPGDTSLWELRTADWGDDEPLVAGRVIIRPLPPESR